MLGSTLARLRSFWRGVRRRNELERGMTEEFHAHIALRAEDLVRAGFTPAEALRRARAEFGSAEQHKHDARASRGLRRVDELRWSWIDLKLGARMLRKYPGLTLVGGLGLAVGIAIAASAFGVISTLVDPRLPLDEGDRVVAIEPIDPASQQDGAPLHDLETWRARVPALLDVAAYRTVDRNLITPGHIEPVRVAEITASGFRIARRPPLLGRYLVDDDERFGAAPVVVLGFSLWQTRFAADPDVVGRTLTLGDIVHRVIGVMPAGFAFPVNNRLWTPLRLRPPAFAHDAPGIRVFARLAPGATLLLAQEQLTAVSRYRTEASPETHRSARTRLSPYPHVFLDGPDGLSELHFVHGVVIMLLVVIGTNVAVLVYARTATRAGEITLRTALGASRLRVLTQFFAEALMLSAAAAAIGMVGASVAFDRVNTFLDRTALEQVPFWMRFSLTPGTAIYVAGLAILAAVIIGVVPALKATGRQVQASLQQMGAGGAGMRLGKIWTLMVVAQVTVTVALMPTVAGAGVAWLRWTISPPPFPTSEFVTATMQVDRQDERKDGPTATRELIARLELDADISALVLMSHVPGSEPVRRVDLERPGPRGSVAVPTAVGHVGENFFTAFQIPLLAGRTFDRRDFSGSSLAVVVNEAFVHKNLSPDETLGQKLRLTDERGAPSPPWLEVVGVVANFPAAIDKKYVSPRMYLALARDAPGLATIAARARHGDAAPLIPRLRDVAASVDPRLRLVELQPFDESLRAQHMPLQALLLATTVVSGSALLLSTAGIYAIVSLSVTRRRREIALRLALGAESRRLLGHLLSRALAQVGIGTGIGAVIALYVNTLDWTGIAVVAAFMFLVAGLASIAPARRGLRIQPTDALKSE